MNSKQIQKKRSSTWIWMGTSSVFYSLSIFVFSLQQLNFDDAVARGLIIPDVINITNTLDLLWNSGGFFQQENQFIAISLIYGWTWFIHPSLCFLVNSALILGSVVIFKRIAINQIDAPSWLIAGILANPYLILSMPGPNKEIPLLFLTIYYIQVVINRRFGWFITSAVLCVISFWLRDGYGIFLFFSLLLIFSLRHREKFFAPIICALLTITAAMYGIFESVIPILSRNNEIYEAISIDQVATGAFAASLNLDPYSPIDGLILFGFRLIYNLVSLAFFPVVTTIDNKIYWIGLGYWVFGLMIFSSVATIFVNIINIKAVENRLLLTTGLTLGAWFMISLSLFAQPRYLMPILPIAFLAVSSASIKLRNLVVFSSTIIALSVISINAGLDRIPPSAYPEHFETPAYIW